MSIPNDLSNRESAEFIGHLIHTALIAGHTVQADALCAQLPGIGHTPPLVGAFQLGPSCTNDALPELHGWLLSDHSPFSDRLPIREGVTHLAPKNLEGQTAFQACLRPLDALGGVTDAVSLRFYIEKRGNCTIIFLRGNNHAPFNGSNLWMLKHLMPAITHDTIQACQQSLPYETPGADPRPNSGNPPERTTEELLNQLSKTERLILDQLQRCETEREVAKAVGRSPNTVHVHVKNIYRKLMVNSKKQLIDTVRQHRPQT